MSLITRLPAGLEDVQQLLKRRAAAEQKKNLWRALYRDAYLYAMPGRETFTWHTEGQYRNNRLFDSTLQEATYTAANTLCALLFPSWVEWIQLVPGAGITVEELEKRPQIMRGLQMATKTFFGYLNASNFNQVISEAALDLQVGTCALNFNEGDMEEPFQFESIPTSILELEEGPNGTLETKFLERDIEGRNLLRMYPGMELFDLPDSTRTLISESPEKKVKVIQCEIYEPQSKNYYGVVILMDGPTICWRFNYGKSAPGIVARASKTAGETYGRGRVLLALSDARTLDRMQEFVLAQAALAIAPPLTAVTDGVLNPYTASLTPNTVIPVASNADNSPSLKAMELGQNFPVTEQMMKDLRERVRRTMLGPEPSEGPVKSATELSIQDRNRLWAMNGEYSRVQAELLAKIVIRGVYILQKKGLIPKFKVDGRSVAVKYTSPFATTQNADELLGLQKTIQTILSFGPTLGPQLLAAGIKAKEMPAYVGRLNGFPERFIMTDDDRKNAVTAAIKLQKLQQQNEAQHTGDVSAASAAGEAIGGGAGAPAPPNAPAPQ